MTRPLPLLSVLALAVACAPATGSIELTDDDGPRHIAPGGGWGGGGGGDGGDDTAAPDGDSGGGGDTGIDGGDGGDDCDNPSPWYFDGDGDGHGDPGDRQDACEAPGDGWLSTGYDCDDDDAATYPGAPEVCDGVDNDCNGDGEADAEAVLGLDESAVTITAATTATVTLHGCGASGVYVGAPGWLYEVEVSRELGHGSEAVTIQSLPGYDSSLSGTVTFYSEQGDSAALVVTLEPLPED